MEHNLQYRRTDKAIRQAFLKLCRERSFNKITVADILDEALVSRGTFYQHFQDKYEIAEQMQEEVLTEFENRHQEIVSEIKTLKLTQFEINSLWCDFGSDFQEKYAVLRKIHTDTVDIEKRFQEQFRRQYLSERNGTYAEMEADLYACMRTALMKQPENPAVSVAMRATKSSDGDSASTALFADIPYKDIIIRACAYSAGFDDLEELREHLRHM